jgi:hypothetical protein
VKTAEPPAGLNDSLYTAVESDGRVTFILARRRKPNAQITLPANEAGEVAANALGGAYDAFDRAAAGLVPPGERRMAISSCALQVSVWRPARSRTTSVSTNYA